MATAVALSLGAAPFQVKAVLPFLRKCVPADNYPRRSDGRARRKIRRRAHHPGFVGQILAPYQTGEFAALAGLSKAGALFHLNGCRTGSEAPGQLGLKLTGA